MKIRSMKFWNLIGIIVGVAIIITGIVVAINPPLSFSTQSGEVVKFGADFYTYQYDATRIAGVNAAVTANNLREIGEMLAVYTGILLIVIGLLTTVKYLKRFFIEIDYEDEDFDYEAIMAEINGEFENAEESNEDDFVINDETLTEEPAQEESILKEEETIETEE